MQHAKEVFRRREGNINHIQLALVVQSIQLKRRRSMGSKNGDIIVRQGLVIGGPCRLQGSVCKDESVTTSGAQGPPDLHWSAGDGSPAPVLAGTASRCP